MKELLKKDFLIKVALWSVILILGTRQIGIYIEKQWGK
jgi:hypothetical protein